jgi:hypothetical protein
MAALKAQAQFEERRHGGGIFARGFSGGKMFFDFQLERAGRHSILSLSTQNGMTMWGVG